MFALTLLAAVLACHPAQLETPATAAPAGPAEPVESVEPVELAEPVERAEPAIPANADLREELVALGLPPRGQGERGTCSIFTTASAIEAAVARLDLHSGRARRLSVEFLNWAAGRAAGAASDGNFFHNALAGFERFGICGEESMPYRTAFDPSLAPTAEALAEAAALRDRCRAALRVRWIVPWVANRFGMSEAEFLEIKAAIARGVPVAAGSGHSRLLVGYRDDPAAPGGGVFATLDSALARFDEVSYQFVREQVADVYVIERAAAAESRRESGATVVAE